MSEFSGIVDAPVEGGEIWATSPRVHAEEVLETHAAKPRVAQPWRHECTRWVVENHSKFPGT